MKVRPPPPLVGNALALFESLVVENAAEVPEAASKKARVASALQPRHVARLRYAFRACGNCPAPPPPALIPLRKSFLENDGVQLEDFCGDCGTHFQERICLTCNAVRCVGNFCEDCGEPTALKSFAYQGCVCTDRDMQNMFCGQCGGVDLPMTMDDRATSSSSTLLPSHLATVPCASKPPLPSTKDSTQRRERMCEQYP